MFTAVVKQGCFQSTVLNHALAVNYSITTTFEASLHFSMCGDSHGVVVTKWSKKGFSKFARAFFTWAPRDEAVFGSMTIDDDAYDLYITLLACQLIVHTDFFAPEATYEIVRFA